MDLTTVPAGPIPETCRHNKYIVTATDYFSKWPEGYPLKDKTAISVVDFLFSVFCLYGYNHIRSRKGIC